MLNIQKYKGNYFRVQSFRITFALEISKSQTKTTSKRSDKSSYTLLDYDNKMDH